MELSILNQPSPGPRARDLLGHLVSGRGSYGRVAAMHSRTINLTCCSSSEVAAATKEAASASEEDAASEVAALAAAVEFSLAPLAFLLLDLLDDAEAVDRCVT